MATTEERLSSLESKFEVFMQTVQDMRQEMRDRDNQRAAELVEIRQRQDEERKALDAKIDRLGDKIQNMALAAFVGFGAIVFAAVSLLKP